MVLPDSDHECSLLPFLKQIAERLEKVEHENAQLKKELYGRRSERSKMPRVKTGEPATPEQAKATRQARVSSITSDRVRVTSRRDHEGPRSAAARSPAIKTAAVAADAAERSSAATAA